MKHAAEKRKIKLLPLWISLGAVLLVLGAAYFLGANYFSTHFGFNTSIDSIDASFKTQDEIKAMIADGITDYQIEIVGREKMRKTFSATDVGLAYVDDGQVAAIFGEQNHWLWFTRLFIDPTQANTHASVSVDSVMLNKVLSVSDFYKDGKMRSPVDASLGFEGSAYIVVPEDVGTTIDKAKTKTQLVAAIEVLASSFNLEETECYINPKITSDDATLNETVATYNQNVPFRIIYDFGSFTEVLDGATTMAWAATNEDGEPVLDEAAVEAWVRDFGLRYDTVGKLREFTTVAGETTTVEGGTWGWEVDEQAEIEAIHAAFTNRTGEVREPIYVQRGVVRTAEGQPDWGTTYIELDLTKQHMWYVVDGAVKLEADVVTGSPYGRSATPPGVYNILEKLSPATLVGEIQTNGKPEYRTKVSYWMRITWAGHGFHDATWQPWFGGNRYTYAGSHGCINMSYSDAQSLYEQIEVGLPVISHH